MAKGNKSEQRKRILLVALGGLFVFAVIYNLFLSPPSRPGRKPSNSNAPAATAPTATTSQPGTAQPSPPKATGQPEEIVYQLMQDLTPLELRHSTTGGPVEPDKERGDATVFAYYVPPPPPPAPIPPPPPITLTGVTPASAVAGTPRRITLIVVANIVPTDAQLMFDGGVRPSRRLNEHQIATDLEPSDYASARPITITIKSASDPKMFSTPTTFSVQPAPEPQF